MVCIRKATLADIPEITACDLLCFPEEDPDTSSSMLNESMRSPLRVVYVAEYGGHIVGYVVAGKDKPEEAENKEEDNEECQGGYISWLAVHPTYRKLGFAAKLMTAAENAMVQEYGCEYVYLHVCISNHAAINLYTKVLGYKFHYNEAKYYLGEDAYLLRKQLPAKHPLGGATAGLPLGEATPKAIHSAARKCYVFILGIRLGYKSGQACPIEHSTYATQSDLLVLGFSHGVDASGMKPTPVELLGLLGQTGNTLDRMRNSVQLCLCKRLTATNLAVDQFVFKFIKYRSNLKWDKIVERFERRLSGWKSKNLTKGGKLTLLNHVLSALPIYHSSIFEAPMNGIHKIERIMRNFLRNESNEEKKYHLVAWKHLVQPKQQGGLGIKQLHLMNVALLMKWLWKFGSDCNPLWKQIIAQKYGLSQTEWCTKTTNQPYGCSIWRGINKHSDTFKANCCMFILGDGSRISFWCDDIWIGRHPLGNRFPAAYNASCIKFKTLNLPNESMIMI